MTDSRELRRRISGWAAVVMILGTACGHVALAPGAASDSRTSSPFPSAQTPVAGCTTLAARDHGALVYDRLRKQVVLFGGAGDQIYNDTWIWNDTCWSQVNPTKAPPPRFNAAYAFDSSLGLTFLYGGRQQAGDSNLYDTWTWDGAAWSPVSAIGGPSLTVPVAAFDRVTNKVIVFGIVAHKSVQTWAWDGKWQQLQPATSPTIRFAAAMAYDNKSGHIILFGGRDPGSRAYLGDTWSWDGANWTQLNTRIAPSGREDAGIADVMDGVLLFGGDDASTQNTDTWLWDGSAWRQMPTLHSPPPNATQITATQSGVLALVRPIGSNTSRTYSLSNGDWVAM